VSADDYEWAHVDRTADADVYRLLAEGNYPRWTWAEWMDALAALGHRHDFDPGGVIIPEEWLGIRDAWGAMPFVQAARHLGLRVGDESEAGQDTWNPRSDEEGVAMGKISAVAYIAAADQELRRRAIEAIGGVA
jgi:hypothetical protein